MKINVSKSAVLSNNKYFKPFYFFDTPEFYKYLGFSWCVDLKQFKKECIKELLKKAQVQSLHYCQTSSFSSHDYRFKKVIDFRLNIEDPILNDQLKSFDNTSCKVKKGKPAKNITSYDSLYQSCWKAHHEYIIANALSKPAKHPDSLDLHDKTEKLMLSNWSARRQRFYISEVNNTTYTTRKIKKKSQYEYVTCRFCSKNKDTYQHWKTDCSNKKIKNIFKEEKSLFSVWTCS
jgi:hypothetical protein